MKISSLNNSINQSKCSKPTKSNIQFQGKLIQLLPDKFEKLGKKLNEVYNKTSEFIDFPFDTFAYKEGDSLVVDTRIVYEGGAVKDVLAIKHLSDIDLKRDDALREMLRINQTTAKMLMAQGSNS